MPDEDVVFDRDAVADECVALDLAVRADRGPALDLDKRSDPGVVADLAAVEVRERLNDDALAELDIVECAKWRVVCRSRQPPENQARTVSTTYST